MSCGSNGTARVTADDMLGQSFARDGRLPRTVIVIAVDEVYFQCSRALIRASLWSGRDESGGLPTPGQILANLTGGTVCGEAYDREWPERAAKSMW